MEVKTGYTLTKHYYSHHFDDLAHDKVIVEVAEDSNITQMLNAFEHFLKASGFSFDGYIDIVPVDDDHEPFIEEPVELENKEPQPPRWAQENAAANKMNKMSVFDEKM